MAGLHLGPEEHLQHIKAVCLKCRQWCFMDMTFKALHLLVLCIKTFFFFKSTLPETFFIFLGSLTPLSDSWPHAWATFPKCTIGRLGREQGMRFAGEDGTGGEKGLRTQPQPDVTEPGGGRRAQRGLAEKQDGEKERMEEEVGVERKYSFTE